ncbi:MAG: YcgN family cysteine cluster protein [Desulfobacterales bacterium]|jgi:uncharacterized cysteine cluster protein YcgN (CxxCxxCC family)
MDDSDQPRTSGFSPFWEQRPLDALSGDQWESLCDGCGRCCLEKMINHRTGKVTYTNLACPLLDHTSCRCRDYANRSRIISDCLSLAPGPIRQFRWLPKTCAYRLLAEGKPLPRWHPLVSGRPESVHEAGISLRGRPLVPRNLCSQDLDAHVVDWGIWAKKATPDG